MTPLTPDDSEGLNDTSTNQVFSRERSRYSSYVKGCVPAASLHSPMETDGPVPWLECVDTYVLMRAHKCVCTRTHARACDSLSRLLTRPPFSSLFSPSRSSHVGCWVISLQLENSFQRFLECKSAGDNFRLCFPLNYFRIL